MIVAGMEVSVVVKLVEREKGLFNLVVTVISNQVRQMYHYTECGLDNIYLVNGYEKHKSAEGEGVSVRNLDGLHRAIGTHLATMRRPLTGREFRFLRVELGMSQRALGDLLRKTDQAVAKWEKEETSLPRADDLVLRTMYLETIGADSKLKPLIQESNMLDRAMQEQKIRFEIDREWLEVREG